jgi:hypothetical protein
MHSVLAATSPTNSEPASQHIRHDTRRNGLGLLCTPALLHHLQIGSFPERIGNTFSQQRMIVDDNNPYQ